jgi:ribosomal protein L3 glutamine methyltransferase
MRYAARRFSAARLAFGHGTHNARDEAVWLLVHVLKIDFDDVQAVADRVLDEREQREALRLIDRRVRTRKPLAYVLGEAWLAGQRFHVDERVIVPRSFIAEFLPDGLAAWLPRRGVKRVLDLCTGSGCLAILAARAFPGSSVDASDISAAALAVARRNVTQYRLRSRIHLVKSDLFARVPKRKYDLIVSNPPYVAAGAMRRLPVEYRSEPRLALAGGRDGLDAVLRIIEAAAGFLAPRGVLVLEIGRNRKALERRAPRTAFTWLGTSAGEDMVVLLTRDQMLSQDFA